MRDCRAEAYKRGIASNHGDPEHLWRGLGMAYTMDGIRRDVKKVMENGDTEVSGGHSGNDSSGSFGSADSIGGGNESGNGGDNVAGCTTAYPEKLTSGWYRVRKAWTDKKSQIGAYKVLAYAKVKADENAGYYVFDNAGKVVYAGKKTMTAGTMGTSAPKPSERRKTNEQLADEVIKGFWGNGAERKKRLVEVGYDYAAVQAIVNRKMK